jgi:hypothetical protein
MLKRFGCRHGNFDSSLPTTVALISKVAQKTPLSCETCRSAALTVAFITTQALFAMPICRSTRVPATIAPQLTVWLGAMTSAGRKRSPLR